MKWKVGKKLFIGALVVMFLQIAMAHRAIIQPISMPQQPTLFYVIFGISLVLFPIVLAVIFSYLLDRIKWLGKKSFLGAFLVSIFIFIILFGASYGFFDGWLQNVFFSTRYDLSPMFYFFGLPVAFPLIFLLDWVWDESYPTIVVLVGMFSVSILFALFYSLFTVAAKKGFKWYRRVLVSVIVVSFLCLFLSNLHHSYVRDLHYQGKCLRDLNVFQCMNSENIGDDYYSYNGEVYLRSVNFPLHEKVEDFEFIEGTEYKFARGANGIYRFGHILTNRVDEWEMMESGYSKDDVNVFYGRTILDDVDLDSFVIFGEGYACDKDDVYYEYNKVYEADPYSFAMTGCTGLGFDYRDYYLYSHPISFYSGLKFYEDKPCFDEVFATCIDALNSKEEEVYEGTTAMHEAESSDGKFFAYVDFPKIMLKNNDNGMENELMSVYETTDGVDFFWSPNNQTVAMTVVNQGGQFYLDTYGTKLFLLEIDEGGGLIKKETVPLRIRYECHDAGCNVGSEDFYFEDEETIIYRTWESKTPYEDAGDDDMLRELNLTE